ncbi:MAG: CDP-alcohol phosphatidyltransferase family protein [Flavonifractor plautii]
MSIPNLLSLLRLVLVPVFAVVFSSARSRRSHRWAVLIYLTAFLTDVADGWIARHFNQITKLGRILDPLADKLMTFTVIICITADGIIPLWAVVVFFPEGADHGQNRLAISCTRNWVM